MGAVIVGSPWLLELGDRGDKFARAAASCLRAQIMMHRRTGHLLDLDSYQVRQSITHSAAWGRVARVPVRCLRCNTVANLTEWVACAEWSREYHSTMAMQARVQFRPHDYLYMQPCPGEQVAADLAASEHPPAPHGEGETR